MLDWGVSTLGTRSGFVAFPTPKRDALAQLRKKILTTWTLDLLLKMVSCVPRFMSGFFWLGQTSTLNFDEWGL